MKDKFLQRIELLKRLDEINKKTSFIGSRGVEWLNDKELEELVNELEEEIRNE